MQKMFCFCKKWSTAKEIRHLCLSQGTKAQVYWTKNVDSKIIRITKNPREKKIIKTKYPLTCHFACIFTCPVFRVFFFSPFLFFIKIFVNACLCDKPTSWLICPLEDLRTSHHNSIKKNLKKKNIWSSSTAGMRR